MRIAILTQPIGHNYGGLLQAFALQKYLRDQGHYVETLDRRTPFRVMDTARRAALNTAKLLLGRTKSIPARNIYERVYGNVVRFRNQNLVLSERITTERQLRTYTRDQGFDAFIVGSDQVWRPRYSPSLMNYFLDFLDDIDSHAFRMSYAASFGVDHWELSPLETARCRELLARFDAVSVREPSGVRLCETFLGRTPECMVDPTLLIRREIYESHAREGEALRSGTVLSYVLDPRPATDTVVRRIVDALGGQGYSILPSRSMSEKSGRDGEEFVYPPVESWLRAFMDAQFVVTDSFHGALFSTIFNKPFVAIGNRKRGVARFTGALGPLGLGDRLIEGPEDISADLLGAKFDWPAVNRKITRQCLSGQKFLSERLGQFGTA